MKKDKLKELIGKNKYFLLYIHSKLGVHQHHLDTRAFSNAEINLLIGIIQAILRGRLSRAQYVIRRKVSHDSALVIQCAYRVFHAKKIARSRVPFKERIRVRHERRMAALRIQVWWRATVHNHSTQSIKKAIVNAKIKAKNRNRKSRRRRLARRSPRRQMQKHCVIL